MEVRRNTTPVAKKPTKMPGYFSELNSYCYLTCVSLGMRATTQMQQLQLPGIELWTMVEGIKRSYVLRCSKLWRERRRAMNPRPAWLGRVSVMNLPALRHKVDAQSCLSAARSTPREKSVLVTWQYVAAAISVAPATYLLVSAAAPFVACFGSSAAAPVAASFVSPPASLRLALLPFLLVFLSHVMILLLLFLALLAALRFLLLWI